MDETNLPTLTTENISAAGEPDSDGVAQQMEWAASVQSGAARAAVLGINDGLATNISLILGMVGAAAGPEVVRLAGLASLVAGACSMAVGEYVSMRAQVELLQRLLAEQREAMRRDPARERAVLRGILRRQGLDEKAAHTVSSLFSQDSERALRVYSRAVLGVNPDELGSPWTTALSSFVTFALGALVPLLPWLVAPGPQAGFISLALGVVAACCIGGVLGWLTHGRVVQSALRQLLLVALASAVTFLVGRLFGTVVS
jgi:vacuolar iron transporter family protein